MTEKEQESIHECQENSWLCPNCDAVWSFDEWQFNKCYCCGYPHNADEDDSDDMDDEPIDYGDDERVWGYDGDSL